MNKTYKYLNSLSILYVEDETDIRDELEYFLKRRVKKLTCARDGQEGLELYKKESFDLVVTDIRMPNLDGISMSKLIKKHDNDAKIVVITAFSDAEYLYECIKLNISNYLTKPLDLQLLIETLNVIAKNIYLEKENKEILNTLSQYKDIVDERSIVSKTDLNGIITYVNEPFEKISGYSKEELLGKSHNIVRHEDSSDELFSDLWKTLNEKRVWSGVIKNKKKNGESYIVDTIIKPILDVNGQVVEYIALRNDITELETSRQYFKDQTDEVTTSLNDSIRREKAYKEAIERSNIILRVSKDRKIIYANEAFCKISGYDKDELINEPYAKIKDYRTDDSTYNKNIDDLENYLNEGNIWQGKVSNTAKNGTLFHCNLTIYPMLDKEGNVVNYMGIRHDITDIENMHIELEETQREIIYKLGEVGETRSNETGNHVKRVAEYSKLLGKKYGLDNSDINILFAASPMHDIGKIGIPDEILNKPAKLNSEEWEIMRTHSEIGYNILKSSNREILKAASIISYTHHEKFDGSGYPKGLKGEDIHIFGRITAIADVFDALGSKRVYKEAWELDNILKFFSSQKGKHFDPKLIDIFMDNLDEFLEIRELYKD